jgi:hypothetical protein
MDDARGWADFADARRRFLDGLSRQAQARREGASEPFPSRVACASVRGRWQSRASAPVRRRTRAASGGPHPPDWWRSGSAHVCACRRGAR